MSKVRVRLNTGMSVVGFRGRLMVRVKVRDTGMSVVGVRGRLGVG